MTGPGYWESRLVAALNGVDEAPVNDDPTVWREGAAGATEVAGGLELALAAVMEDEVLGEATRASIGQSVTSMREALTYRSGRLAIGESAAATAAAALSGAKSQFASLAGVPAAPTPETPLPLATPEERVATQQSNQQAAEQHAGLVAAREAACRTIYQNLQTGLDTAADDYARINAHQPTGPDDRRGGDGPVGPGTNRPTRPGRDDQGELEVVGWEPRDPDRDPDQDRDPDRDPDGIRPTPVDPINPINPTNPVLPVGPGTFTPGAPGENGLLEARPGVPPALGGGASPSVVGAGGGSGLAGTAVAGGVAAGAGLSAAMRAGGGGLLAGSGSAAGTSRPFVAGGGQGGGAAARGGGATAGRGMAGAGADANGRGGSGRGGAGGRGGRGAGGAGGAGGRGATGGGGTAGRGAGRRRDRDEDDPRSFLGREDDWLDDDHTGPAVID